MADRWSPVQEALTAHNPVRPNPMVTVSWSGASPVGAGGLSGTLVQPGFLFKAVKGNAVQQRRCKWGLPCTCMGHAMGLMTLCSMGHACVSLSFTANAHLTPSGGVALTETWSLRLFRPLQAPHSNVHATHPLGPKCTDSWCKPFTPCAYVQNSAKQNAPSRVVEPSVCWAPGSRNCTSSCAGDPCRPPQGRDAPGLGQARCTACQHAKAAAVDVISAAVCQWHCTEWFLVEL